MRAAAQPRAVIEDGVEELEMKLTGARARVRALAAAVQAEEGSLVQATLAEAEEAAASTPQTHQPGGKQAQHGARPTEQRLRARLAQTEQLLRKEHEDFKKLLQEDSVQLALAVEQRIGDYYADVRTVRRRGNPSRGPAHAVAQAGSAVHKLKGERSRLAEAVRSLRQEREALAEQARMAERSKETLVDALRRRDALRGRHAY